MEKSFWKSKKWWAMVVAVSIPVLNKLVGLDFNTTDVVAVVSPLIAYILGQGVADIGKHSKT
jgi:hypothetical protein